MTARDDRTPNTARVREKYATVLDATAGWKWSDEWAADFDRWLLDYEGRIAAAARADGFRAALTELVSPETVEAVALSRETRPPLPGLRTLHDARRLGIHWPTPFRSERTVVATS